MKKKAMVEYIATANADLGIAIVLIEHDMGVVMDISDWIVVLDHGEKICEGRPEEVRDNSSSHRSISRTGNEMNDIVFALELTITGMLIGLLYSMVALGFVLIFKASLVFNFAQGAMTLCSALTLVGLIPLVGFWFALLGTILVMCIVAISPNELLSDR